MKHDVADDSATAVEVQGDVISRSDGTLAADVGRSLKTRDAIDEILADTVIDALAKIDRLTSIQWYLWTTSQLPIVDRTGQDDKALATWHEQSTACVARDREATANVSADLELLGGIDDLTRKEQGKLKKVLAELERRDDVR